MAEPNWLRHSLRLGLVDVRRRLRNVRRNRTRFRLLIATVVLMVIVLGAQGILYAYWLNLSGPISVPPLLRLGLSGAWLVPIWYFFRRVLLFYRQLHNKSFVLTTVSTRTAVVSLLVADGIFACLALAFPTVVAIGMVLYWFHQWVSIGLIVLAALAFATSTTVIGYTAGFASLHLSARSASGERSRVSRVARIIVRIVILVGFLAVITNQIPQFDVSALGVAWLPTSWLIDLALLGTPTTVSVGRAIGIVLVAVVVVGGGSALVERLATAYWFDGSRSPSSATGGDGPPESSVRDKPLNTLGSDVLAGAISPLFVPTLLSTPTQRVAQLALVRLRRAPRRLSFLVGPAVSFTVIYLVQAAHLLQVLPTLCVVAIPWLAGATFGLNPVGDMGAVLPSVLLSISGRKFIRGLMIPGLVYGLPITVAGTVITGVVSPDSMPEVGGLAVVGAILTVVAVVLAPAIGMWFPRFDAIIVGERGRILPPSVTTFIIYTALIGFLGRTATIPVLGSSAMSWVFKSADLSVGLVRVSGTVGVLVITLAIGLFSYWWASSRFDAWTIQQT